MLESKIKTKVCARLRKNGWYIVHLIQTNTNGIPDTMCIRNGVVVFIEFKQVGKVPRALQLLRIKELRQQKITVHTVDDVNFNM